MSIIQIMNDAECDLYESCKIENLDDHPYDDYYKEAVFNHGKETLKPIEKCIEDIHNELLSQLGLKEDEKGKLTKSGKAKFNWESFYKSINFKHLEDELKKVFGFRSVDIYPLKEEYNAGRREFWYNYINAYTSMVNRFPIDGLVTEKGFYDSTHSISLIITFSNTAIRDLTPGQFIATLLHEIGHNIDPALVDIKYTQVNVLSKYLTDRKNKITNAEKRVIEKTGGKSAIGKMFLSLGGSLLSGIKKFFIGLKNLFTGDVSESELNRRLEKFRQIMQREKKQFTRQEFSEAFADNFARMYGYAKELAEVLKKSSSEDHRWIKSWYSRERSRQEAIIEMITYALADEHKTDIHRINALIREYKSDIEDKNTPAPIKKQMQQDLEELEKVYQSYADDFGEFYKRCAQIMKEELEKIDEIAAKKSIEEKPTVPKDEDKKKNNDKDNDELDESVNLE